VSAIDWGLPRSTLKRDSLVDSSGIIANTYNYSFAIFSLWLLT